MNHLVKFNSLCEMVKDQRNLEETGDRVEKDLRNHCRQQAGMKVWEDIGMMIEPQQEDGEEEDDEVDAVGECDIYQI